LAARFKFCHGKRKQISRQQAEACKRKRIEKSEDNKLDCGQILSKQKTRQVKRGQESQTHYSTDVLIYKGFNENPQFFKILSMGVRGEAGRNFIDPRSMDLRASDAAADAACAAEIAAERGRAAS